MCVYIFYMCSKMLAVMGIMVLILAIVNDLAFHLCATAILRKNSFKMRFLYKDKKIA